MRKLATIRIIRELRAIPDADKIELAMVDGWNCVVKRGEFAIGEHVIYCEIDSFLPVRPEFEFLRKSSFKMMGDQAGFRLRTVKLRGQISQGLLLPISVLESHVDGCEFEIGEDFAKELGIQKYDPPLPASLSGQVVGPFPAPIEKTDEERIQNLASEYDSYKTKEFFVSEKLDGTSFTAFVDDEFGVCGRNWQLAQDAKNSHWQMVERLQLKEKLLDLGRRVAIQGELVGPGIQKNRYRLSRIELFVFNAFDISNSEYVAKSELIKLCDQLGLSIVPNLGEQRVPDTLDEILEIAEGKSELNQEIEREGLVWVYGAGSNRVSFKTISNKFLTKHG